MAQLVLERLKRKFGDGILETQSMHGNECAVVGPEILVQVAQFLKKEQELYFDMPIDCTAIDLQQGPLRYEVVWHLYSTRHRHRLRLKVRVLEDQPEVSTLTQIWPGMNWFERETWDLYGIRFLGHQNLKRILMYEEFVGHPLRKDYPVDGRQPLVPMRKINDIPTQRKPPIEALNRP